MKWITRENAAVDRIACPWLIRRFIDPEAEFLFVNSAEVPARAKQEGAIPFDVEGVELGHRDGRCSFESIVLKYGLGSDAALARMADIVLGAVGFAAAEAEITQWPGYTPTPLVTLPALARRLGLGALFYKDEGRRFGLRSFKALGGAYAVRRLLAQSKRTPAQVTVTSAT